MCGIETVEGTIARWTTHPAFIVARAHRCVAARSSRRGNASQGEGELGVGAASDVGDLGGSGRRQLVEDKLAVVAPRVDPVEGRRSNLHAGHAEEAAARTRIAPRRRKAESPTEPTTTTTHKESEQGATTTTSKTTNPTKESTKPCCRVARSFHLGREQR